jgi:hypothetical protein
MSILIAVQVLESQKFMTLNVGYLLNWYEKKKCLLNLDVVCCWEIETENWLEFLCWLDNTPQRMVFISLLEAFIVIYYNFTFSKSKLVSASTDISVSMVSVLIWKWVCMNVAYHGPLLLRGILYFRFQEVNVLPCTSTDISRWIKIVSCLKLHGGMQ